MAVDFVTECSEKAIPTPQYRWCTIRSDVYQLFLVTPTDRGFEEAYIATLFRVESADLSVGSNDNWGVITWRGTEICDDEEVYASLEAATARLRERINGDTSQLLPALA